MHAARQLNLLSMAAITFMPACPVLLLRITGSISVYPASVYHPTPAVSEHAQLGGYRFYGLIGFLIAVPRGLRDSWRASQDAWRDLQMEPPYPLQGQRKTPPLIYSLPS